MTAGPPRVARGLHPGAWWLWALGLAAAASRTTNPLLLALILGVLGLVVARRRTAAPWARGFRTYLLLGLVVIGVRVVLRMLLDGQRGQHVLFTLPEVPLPAAAAGIRVGGPVSAEGLVGAFADGLRLATLLACVGAANVLANPKRLLRAVPGALHEVGAAIVVALSVAPQLVESLQRVRRARRLRGGAQRGLRALRAILVPVLEDALERSLRLAAAMDSRGYGRAGPVTRSQRAATGALLLGGLAGLCVGVYGLLDGTAPRALGAPLLAVGTVVAAAGLTVAGKRVRRTTYRADPWRSPEWAVAACGLAAAAGMAIAAGLDVTGVVPPTRPLAWPPLPAVPTLAILAAAAAGWLAPPVEATAPRPDYPPQGLGAQRSPRPSGRPITPTPTPAPPPGQAPGRGPARIGGGA